MSGILLNSQMDLYYNLRNVFLILFGLLAIGSIIYGIRVRIILIMQKHFGIEKRREIARMQSGKAHVRKTSARLKSTQQSSRIGVSKALPEKLGIDVSKVTTMKLQIEQGILPVKEEMETTMLEDVQETVVLDSQSETTVLGTQSENMMQDQKQDTGFRKGKDMVIVHGEDIL